MLVARAAVRQTGEVEHHTRPAPCSHCGDTVLLVSRAALKLFGLRVTKGEVDRVEHADPSPDGEVFDGVDADCHRAPVVPGYPR